MTSDSHIKLKAKLFLLSLLFTVIIIIVTGAVVSLLWHSLQPPETSGLAISIPFLFTYITATLLVATLCLKIWNKLLKRQQQIHTTRVIPEKSLSSVKRKIPLGTYIRYIALLIILSLLLNFINSTVFHQPEITPWQQDLLTAAGNSKLLILLFLITAAIIAPIWEELVFRGLLFSSLNLFLPQAATTIITALLWSLAHIQQYNVLLLAEIILLGIILGVSRARTGSTKIPIILHICNNLIAFTNMYYYIK